jgi:hypothetical protein
MCDESGGVDTWYWFAVKDGSGASNIATYTTLAGEVTALTLVSGKQAFALNVEMETSTFTDTGIGGRSEGSYAREQEATVVMHGNTKEMIVTLEAAGKGRTALIAKMNDGTYELIFATKGAKMSDVRSPGTNYEDMNGNTLTFSGKETEKAPKISAVIVNSLLTVAP